MPDTTNTPANLPALASSPVDSPKFDRATQIAFLRALAASGEVRSAARHVGVAHTTAYRARHASPDLATAWDAALVIARHHAEDVLRTRALEGTEEEVWYHGEIVATRRRFDSRLLLAHLGRLDRLETRGYVAEVAADFDEALDRFARGEVLCAQMLEDDPLLEDMIEDRAARAVARHEAEWREDLLAVEDERAEADARARALEEELAALRGRADGAAPG